MQHFNLHLCVAQIEVGIASCTSGSLAPHFLLQKGAAAAQYRVHGLSQVESLDPSLCALQGPGTKWRQLGLLKACCAAGRCQRSGGDVLLGGCFVRDTWDLRSLPSGNSL